MSKLISILGISLLAASESEWLERVRKLSKQNKQQWIATVNAEMIVHAYYDPSFRSLLQTADYATIDGSGIIFIERLKGKRLSLSQRMTGVRLTHLLLNDAEKYGERVAIIVPTNAYAKPNEIEKAINTQYPELIYKVIIDRHDALAEINSFAPTIVFVTHGSPTQEEWIHRNVRTIPSLRIAVGVGGTFDFISGKIIRAPQILQAGGLEWLWRLWIEPKRARRIYNAVIVFPYIMLLKN